MARAHRGAATFSSTSGRRHGTMTTTKTAQDFADRLTDHAQQVLDRVQSQQREDLLIFENQAGAVAEGRFFCTGSRA